MITDFAGIFPSETNQHDAIKRLIKNIIRSNNIYHFLKRLLPYKLISILTRHISCKRGITVNNRLSICILLCLAILGSGQAAAQETYGTKVQAGDPDVWLLLSTFSLVVGVLDIGQQLMPLSAYPSAASTGFWYMDVAGGPGSDMADPVYLKPYRLLPFKRKQTI
ncbi:MAG: hypothetical protein PHS80_04435 [Methanothrix sp.]|nr:hypothetical protein [Methanothrix sp.]MDD4446148.1 hypothetical protein [Methanothrix sp.]